MSRAIGLLVLSAGVALVAGLTVAAGAHPVVLAAALVVTAWWAVAPAVGDLVAVDESDDGREVRVVSKKK